MTDSNLALMLESIEKRMSLALQQSRATFEHRGIRGEFVETEFREMLDRHLPRYLSVGTGEVIDITGARSRQTDVIVANAEQPFRYERDEPGIYVVEGVAAAGEVKSGLTTKELDDIIAKGAAFKKLRVGDLGGYFVEAHDADYKRYYSCPPFFAVAFESNVAPETLVDRLGRAEFVRAADGDGDSLPAVDAVFVLGRGMAVNYGDGHGAIGLRLIDGDRKERAAGWVWHETSAVLGELMLWLTSVMPRAIRLSSIAPRYLRSRTAEARTVVLPHPSLRPTFEPM